MPSTSSRFLVRRASAVGVGPDVVVSAIACRRSSSGASGTNSSAYTADPSCDSDKSAALQSNGFQQASNQTETSTTFTVG